MKIKCYVNTGYSNCKHEEIFEIDDAEWNEMNEEEREQVLDQMAGDYMGNCIEFGAYPLEDK